MTKHLQLYYYGGDLAETECLDSFEGLSIYSGIYIGTEKSMTKFLFLHLVHTLGKNPFLSDLRKRIVLQR